MTQLAILEPSLKPKDKKQQIKRILSKIPNHPGIANFFGEDLIDRLAENSCPKSFLKSMDNLLKHDLNPRLSECIQQKQNYVIEKNSCPACISNYLGDSQ